MYVPNNIDDRVQLLNSSEDRLIVSRDMNRALTELDRSSVKTR